MKERNIIYLAKGMIRALGYFLVSSILVSSIPIALEMTKACSKFLCRSSLQSCVSLIEKENTANKTNWKRTTCSEKYSCDDRLYECTRPNNLFGGAICQCTANPEKDFDTELLNAAVRSSLQEQFGTRYGSTATCRKVRRKEDQDKYVFRCLASPDNHRSIRAYFTCSENQCLARDFWLATPSECPVIQRELFQPMMCKMCKDAVQHVGSTMYTTMSLSLAEGYLSSFLLDLGEHDIPDGDDDFGRNVVDYLQNLDNSVHRMFFLSLFNLMFETKGEHIREALARLSSSDDPHNDPYQEYCQSLQCCSQ